MGLLNPRPQFGQTPPTAQTLPGTPTQLPGMPSQFPTFGAQSQPGPRMGEGAQMNMPNFSAGGPTFSPGNQMQNYIPAYGNGYEGDTPFSQMSPQRVSQFLRSSNMPVPMGPWSLAGQRTGYADMPLEGNDVRMNGEMPVTWYAQDWQRHLPK